MRMLNLRPFFVLHSVETNTSIGLKNQDTGTHPATLVTIGLLAIGGIGFMRNTNLIPLQSPRDQRQI